MSIPSKEKVYRITSNICGGFMKIVPIIIWYNPDKIVRIKNNIEIYSNHFENVIIVDNSSYNNEHLLENINNALYYPNYENVGISKALNIGCERAVENGFEWVLTMDQDSSWSNTEELHRYIQIAEKLYLINTKNISFSPSMKRMNEIIQKGNDESFQYTKIIWTSGNILNLKAWLDIGKFNEQLFIDDVDHEFCYRLRSRGYHLINIQHCYLNHEIGEHRDVRMYYIVRNCLYMKKYWHEFWTEYNRFSYLVKLFIDKFIHIKIKDLYYMVKGLIHAKKGIYGKYK
jgi:rhamnosyltransferase